MKKSVLLKEINKKIEDYWDMMKTFDKSNFNHTNLLGKIDGLYVVKDLIKKIEPK